MNLQQTIDELEQEAKKFQQAADALRALQQNGAAPALATTSSAKSSASKAGAKATKPASKTMGKGGKGKGQSKVSPETRAKIATTLRARHAAKKAAAS